jgi:NAD+ synthase (glutamine-hydrolysing)
MKIALAQLNFKIGAFEENSEKIISAIQESRENGADLVVFSELSVCGYPPLDLLEHKYFIEQCLNSVETIAREAREIAVILGSPTINTEKKGKNLHNSALFIENGKVKHVFHKALLPTYDIFDEYRHFQPSDEFSVITFKGLKLGVAICEDLWFEQPLLTNFGKEKLYIINPVKEIAELGCDLLINIAASPFAYNHEAIKSEILSDNARKYHLPVYYVNQVGANTELVFDGGSRVINEKGNCILKMDLFREGLSYIETDTVSGLKPSSVNHAESFIRIKMIHDALILGIHDYFSKMNFTNAVIGLSGGIDSAVTLVLASRALGAENVRALLLPSQYSSEHSVTDAAALAENLKVRYDIIPIKEIFLQYFKGLAPLFEGRSMDVTEENIQARIRSILLMAVSNKFGNILLNTSNKSEAAVGYGTLYGDMAGGIAVLGDVYKTDVYHLARFINRENEIIPVNSIIKPPSAELRPNQKDSDSLPEYDILDKILFNYIELQKSSAEIINEGFEEGMVRKTIQMVNANEYKRYQSPPIIRVSSKAFGPGRRMPLVADYPG